MTEPNAPSPHDPAQPPSIELPAAPEPRPLELPSCVGEPVPALAPARQSAPPPVPPYAVPAAAAPSTPSVPPRSPAPAAPLPPLFTPPPPEPARPPFEPEPPVQPPTPPPGAPPSYGSPFPAPAEDPRPSSEGWALMAHLSTVLALGCSWLLIGFVGPLIIWLAKKDDDPEVDWHGREALNFQLNLLLFWLAGVPLLLFCCLGLLLWAVLPLYGIVLGLIATIKAADGKRWRYPFTLRLLND